MTANAIPCIQDSVAAFLQTAKSITCGLLPVSSADEIIDAAADCKMKHVIRAADDIVHTQQRLSSRHGDGPTSYHHPYTEFCPETDNGNWRLTKWFLVGQSFLHHLVDLVTFCQQTCWVEPDEGQQDLFWATPNP